MISTCHRRVNLVSSLPWSCSSCGLTMASGKCTCVPLGREAWVNHGRLFNFTLCIFPSQLCVCIFPSPLCFCISRSLLCFCMSPSLLCLARTDHAARCDSQLETVSAGMTGRGVRQNRSRTCSSWLPWPHLVVAGTLSVSACRSANY